MNKTSAILVGIGVLVLIGIGYLALKPTSQQPVNQNTNIENSQRGQSAENNVIEAVFDYKTGDTAEPKVVRVQEGQKVVIKATADVADEIHLHGYDLSKEAEANEQITIEFTADKTGRFPIELEKLKKDIGVIEVYPK